MILRKGWYLGLALCLSTISAWRLSRILFAIAVPSILAAAMVGDEIEKARLVEVDAGEECAATTVAGRGKRPVRKGGGNRTAAQDDGFVEKGGFGVEADSKKAV